MNREKIVSLAPVVLRWGIGFVFIWFGWSGVTEPGTWSGLVPEWTRVIASPEVLVRIHGIVELVGGFLLVTGLWVGLVSSILFLSLVHTIFLLSSGAIIVRDIGIAAALLSMCFSHFPLWKKNNT